MIALIAVLAAVACSAGLFAVETDPHEKTSAALWLPLIWCLINGSRPISEWMGGMGRVNSTEYTEGTPLDAAIYALMLLIGLLILNLRSEKVRKFIQFNPQLILFLSYCAASILWSDYAVVAAKRWIKELGDVVMVLLVLTDPFPLAAIKRVFARTAFVLVPLSIAFILFLPGLSTFRDPVSGIVYYSGLTTQKNQLGQSCMVCGVACLWLLLGALEARKTLHVRLQLAAYAAMLAATLWLIVKANSMTSLSCFAVAGTVMILISQRWIAAKPHGVHAVFGSAVGLAVFAIFLDTAGFLLQALGRNSTLTGRTDIWRAVLALRTNPLIGTGFESFWLGSRLQFVWDATEKGIEQAHNGYIEIYINLGWIGLALLGWVIVAGYRNSLAAFYRDRQAGRLGIAFLTAALIFNVSEAGFRIMTLIWFAFLLAVTGIPSNAEQKPVAQAARRPLQRFIPTGSTRILQ